MKRILALFFLASLTAAEAGAQVGLIFGKIAMADGSQIPDKVAIQRDCGGLARTATFADRKGQFSFQWNQSAEFMPDASSAGGGALRGERNVTGAPSLDSAGGSSAGGSSAGGSSAGGSSAGGSSMLGCMLRAEAPGYRSNPIAIDDRQASVQGYDVGTIVLNPVGGADKSSVSGSSLKAPRGAKRAYEKSLEDLGKGKSADAEKDLEKAVGLYPGYADAWLDLGKLRLLRKADEPAREAFQKAVDADPRLPEAQALLGMLELGAKEWADAEKHLDTALRLDPVNLQNAWFNDAVAKFNLKNFDGAETSVRKAMAQDPQHKNPQTDYLLGIILASKHDYKGASEEFRAYLRLAPDGPDAGNAKTQLVELGKLQDLNRR